MTYGNVEKGWSRQIEKLINENERYVDNESEKKLVEMFRN